MQIINLYRYTRPDGGVTVSPVKPEGEYEPMYRLVADEGMALTKDGENLTSCADVLTHGNGDAGRRGHLYGFDKACMFFV